MPNRKLGKQIISSKLLLILSLLVLVFFTINLTKAIINRQDLMGEINLLQEEIDSLESSNHELTSLIEYFKTIDFVETEARTKLNLRKPGEKIIIVPKEGTLETASDKELNKPKLIMTEIKDIPNIKRWWNYFFEVN